MEDDKHKCMTGDGVILCAGQCPSGRVDGRAVASDVSAPYPGF